MTDATADATAAEDAVRRYLAFVEDPSAAQDGGRVAELEQALADADDPIEKIKLASELYRVQNADGSDLRQEFVTHAKAWADDNGVVAEAFLQLGVPPEDLREAGFAVGGRGGRRQAAPRADGRRRAARVSVDDIREVALRISGPFTLSELRDLAGGTPATVRKALDTLLADDRVADLGPDKAWSGRGRAPHLYRRS